MLESANIKLAAVVADVLGTSGREMLEALIAGAQDPIAMAQFARSRMRRRIPDLQLALRGRVEPHQRFLLRRILDHIDFLDASLARTQQEITERLAPDPYAEALRLLQTIPGIQATVAAALIAEIGVDMSRFPSACAAQALGLVGGPLPRQ